MSKFVSFLRKDTTVALAIACVLLVLLCSCNMQKKRKEDPYIAFRAKQLAEEHLKELEEQKIKRLVEAIFSDDTTYAKEYFKANPESINQKIIQSLWNPTTQSWEKFITPLVASIIVRKESTVDLLLKMGADPNKKTEEGKSSLSYSLNDTSIFKSLIKYGADIYQRKVESDKPLFYNSIIRNAIACNSDVHPIFRVLLEQTKLDPNLIIDTTGKTLLIYALANDEINVVEVLLNHGASCNLKTTSGINALLTVAHNIRESRRSFRRSTDQDGLRLNILSLLLSQKNIDLDQKDERGYTAFEYLHHNQEFDAIAIFQKYFPTKYNYGKVNKERLEIEREEKKMEIARNTPKVFSTDLLGIPCKIIITPNDQFLGMYGASVKAISKKTNEKLYEYIYTSSFDPSQVLVYWTKLLGSLTQDFRNILDYGSHYMWSNDNEQIDLIGQTPANSSPPFVICIIWRNVHLSRMKGIDSDNLDAAVKEAFIRNGITLN